MKKNYQYLWNKEYPQFMTMSFSFNLSSYNGNTGIRITICLKDPVNVQDKQVLITSIENFFAGLFGFPEKAKEITFKDKLSIGRYVVIDGEYEGIINESLFPPFFEEEKYSDHNATNSLVVGEHTGHEDSGIRTNHENWKDKKVSQVTVAAKEEPVAGALTSKSEDNSEDKETEGLDKMQSGLTKQDVGGGASVGKRKKTKEVLKNLKHIFLPQLPKLAD